MSRYGPPLWDLRPDITSCLKVAVLFLWGALSDERTGLQFAVVRFAQNPKPYFIVSSRLGLPQPGGPGPRIYIPQEQGGPGTGFAFRRLLRLAGQRRSILTGLDTG
jgi:hypothetical protein